MDGETWTSPGVLATIAGVVVTVVIGILAWWPSHRSANAAEQSNRMTADAQAREEAARQEALRAHFRLTNGPFLAGLGHDTNSFTLMAKNTGAHTAEDVRFGIAMPGSEPEVGKNSRTVEAGQPTHYELRRPFRGMETIFPVLITYRDGIGERRQTFTVRFYRESESMWQFGGITETTPDAP